MREECALGWDLSSRDVLFRSFQDRHWKLKCAICCSHLPLLAHTHAFTARYCPYRTSHVFHYSQHTEVGYIAFATVGGRGAFFGDFWPAPLAVTGPENWCHYLEGWDRRNAAWMSITNKELENSFAVYLGQIRKIQMKWKAPVLFFWTVYHRECQFPVTGIDRRPAAVRYFLVSVAGASEPVSVPGRAPAGETEVHQSWLSMWESTWLWLQVWEWLIQFLKQIIFSCRSNEMMKNIFLFTPMISGCSHMSRLGGL